MRRFNDSPPRALRLLAPGAAAREECVTAFLLRTGTMWGWKWGIYPLVVRAVAAKSSLLVDIWVNYNDLTTTSLEIMVSKGNHPQMALIQISELL